MGDYMIVILIILLLLFIVLFCFSKGSNSDYINGLSKKEERLVALYPMAAFIRNHIEPYLSKEQEKKQVIRFQKLHPESNGKDAYKLHLYQRDSIVLFILFFVLIIATTACGISMRNQNGIHNYRITRPTHGTEQKLTLLFHTKMLEEKLDISLNARRVQGEELTEYLLSLEERLLEIMLLDNNSSDNVQTNLYFIDEAAGGITLKWRPEDYSLIGTSGNLYNEEIGMEGVITTVSAHISYYGEAVVEFIFPIHIYPPSYTEEERLYQEIVKAVDLSSTDSSFEEYMLLPDSVGNETIVWRVKQDNITGSILVFGMFAGIFIAVAMSQEVKKKEKMRTRQMYIDYPNIICKFTLLLGAGMTIRSVWECIAKDYEKRKSEIDNKKFMKHYVYEEMLVTLHELELGISEAKAYENFGKRCSLIPYLKFTTTLVQNLKKGTQGILPLLEMEAKNAFAERKELSKRLGEEAGTKLQLPLMLYLVLVLVIILVPAFLSF